MERKTFLAAAAGAGAALATAAAALAAPTPNPKWMRNQNRSDVNVRRVRRHLEHVIDELQHDRHDYGGHREKALDLLQRARQELLAAEQFDAAHPGTSAAPGHP